MGNEILKMNFIFFSVSVQWVLAWTTEIALQQNKKALIMAKKQCSSIGIISPCHISLVKNDLKFVVWTMVGIFFGMWGS